MHNNIKKELPKRKYLRLKDFDYSCEGSYFLTICTQHRKNILSAIVGEGYRLSPTLQEGWDEPPLPKLTRYGKIVDKWIQKIPEKYPAISVDSYVIMPNHIHLLLSIIKDDGRGIFPSAREEKLDPSPTVNAAIAWLKHKSTIEINKSRGIRGEKIFQRSFYDHIVRNHKDYDEIYEYIYQNPARWQYDKLFSEE